jgi:hypothetical protein
MRIILSFIQQLILCSYWLEALGTSQVFLSDCGYSQMLLLELEGQKLITM